MFYQLPSCLAQLPNCLVQVVRENTRNVPIFGPCLLREIRNSHVCFFKRFISFTLWLKTVHYLGFPRSMTKMHQNDWNFRSWKTRVWRSCRKVLARQGRILLAPSLRIWKASLQWSEVKCGYQRSAKWSEVYWVKQVFTWNEYAKSFFYLSNFFSVAKI